MAKADIFLGLYRYMANKASHVQDVAVLSTGSPLQIDLLTFARVANGR
jgi:hypothetical protein